MSTTTIRLPEELKARIESLASQSGQTAHAFMLSALDEVTQDMVREREFHAEALRRLEDMERSGEYIELDDLRRYAQALARGQSAPRPTIHKLPGARARRTPVR
jgi:predicted transcriptional regulator